MTQTTEQPVGGLLPTLPGLVSGIVGSDPWTLQCADCASTVTTTDLGLRPGGVGVLVILSGYHFHTCEGRDGVRRCPACLARVQAICPGRACKSGW